MCGIAGFSLSPNSSVPRTLAAQALLAAIAERGADAVGYAFRCQDDPIAVHKQRSGASALLDRIDVPGDASELLVHVRDYTKGHPRITANNHPIRHGAVVGIHNGIIFNDEEILAEHGFNRAAPQMTVDSEAIFALVDAWPGRAQVFEELRGSMAAAWLDERRPGRVFCARGAGRPLWLGESTEGAFFASTKQALEIVERFVGLRLRKREIPEGLLISLSEGCVAREQPFAPNRAFSEQALPAVRAPQEGASCLKRLAALAGA